MLTATLRIVLYLFLLIVLPLIGYSALFVLLEQFTQLSQTEIGDFSENFARLLFVGVFASLVIKLAFLKRVESKG